LGRMVLAQLAIFAEFERETICERTRDKMRAARRQGRWTGGHVPLGYDLRDSRLHKNEEEARRVVEIFELFLQRGTLAGTAAELVRRGWRPKQGAKRRVSEFSATRLARMLANPAYVGRVHAHGQLVEGQHEAIVDADLWDRVQAALRGKKRNVPPQVHRAPKSLLGELLRCARCGAAMTSSSTAARGKRHRYYVCKTAQLRGARACPGSRVPAQALEEFVVSRVAAMGRDPSLAAEVVAGVKAALAERRAKAQAEQTACAQERARWERERERLAAVVAHGGEGADSARAKQADVAAALEALTAREQGAQAACDALVGLRGDEGAVRGALGDFGPLWGALEPAEKASVLRELLDEIACDAVGGTVTLRPKSKTLAALLRQEVTP
ncbi:MAG: recombinase zinc beta ribbon domain-containing protein, partial [Planctomycetes bacterium]|nr:recombinase zinc beta ribbon domain-containing protein [Planctomycetota bacterium]